MTSSSGEVRRVLDEVTASYVAAGLMRVTEGPAPTDLYGDVAYTIVPQSSEGSDLQVFGRPDVPGYLFASDGPGYEFWQQPDDLALLRDLVQATINGRYRWWTEYEARRLLLRPWRTQQVRVTVSEWGVPGEPVTVRHYSREPWQPPEGQALPYPPAAIGP